jgi:hypothetical protein
MLKPMTAALKQNISCHPINLHFADWKELRNHSGKLNQAKNTKLLALKFSGTFVAWIFFA